VNRWETWLRLVLRITGIVALPAIVAVFMPREWMAAIHAWLGLGQFPAGPIVEYLARGLSAFYAMLGGLVLLVSFDVRRHEQVIRYLAVVGLVFGVVIFAIDLLIGLPLFWTVGEGPATVALSAAILILQWRAKAAEPPAGNSR